MNPEDEFWGTPDFDGIGGPENMEGTPVGQFKSVVLERRIKGNKSRLHVNLPYAMTRSDAVSYANHNWPEFQTVSPQLRKAEV